MINTNLKSLAPRREQYKREITLVSGGYYNTKAFPSGTVTVYPWDSAIDAWFTERMRLPNRERALWEAAAQVASLNGCSVNDMLMGDILTILMVSKSIRKNCVVEYTATCPKCSRAHAESITIPNDLPVNGKKAPDFKGLESMVLPDCQDAVVFRFLNVGDSLRIEERSADDRKVMSDHLAQILLPIASVGGGTPETTDEMLKWYNALSPNDADFLEKEQERRYPRLDTALPHVCDGCQNKFTYDLELNRDFFRAGER